MTFRTAGSPPVAPSFGSPPRDVVALLAVVAATFALQFFASTAPLVELLRAEGTDIPVVVGGIIPQADIGPLKDAGVARVYTPKDFELNRIMGEIADLVAERNGVGAPQPASA